MVLENCWFKMLCGRGDGRLCICTTSRQAQKDAQTPNDISTPAALRCWSAPARSILVQLRALALGWTGGGAKEESNQLCCRTGMEGDDS